jgi:hypothetical protein
MDSRGVEPVDANGKVARAKDVKRVTRLTLREHQIADLVAHLTERGRQIVELLARHTGEHRHAREELRHAHRAHAGTCESLASSQPWLPRHTASGDRDSPECADQKGG